MHPARASLLSALLLCAVPARADDADLHLSLRLIGDADEAPAAGVGTAIPAAPLPPPTAERSLHERGFFLEDRYRWAEMNVFSRIAFDVIAIPLNIVTWDPWDWTQFAFFSTVVGGLWLGASPSADVRIDRWIHSDVNPYWPTIWSVPMQSVLWPSLLIGGVGTWWWAAATGHTDIEQGLSLMAEALTVSQVYHVLLKVMIGRDGPLDGNRLGLSYGPANAIEVYPAGWPSGHSATLFALMRAGFAYFRPPWWAQVIGYSTIGALGLAHVIDHRHYLSEVIAGAAMGWYAGDWVVKHRASWLYGERKAVEVTIVPVATGGTTGLAVVGRF
jgi:membrane-associated phospholipid phosphatase